MSERVMPEGWCEVALGEVCSKIGSGSTPRGGSNVYVDEGVPLIRSLNIHFDEFKENGLAHISPEAAQKLKGVEVKESDVLLNITGASIGRVNLSPKRLSGARVNQHVCIIRPIEGVYGQYVRYFLSSPDMQRLIHSEESGATRQALTKKKVECFRLPLPAYGEQVVLANKIDELLAQVNNLKARLDGIPAVLKRFRQSVLAAAVSGQLTTAWGGNGEFSSFQNIGSLAIDIRYGTSKKCSSGYGSVPVLRIPNIGDGKVSLGDLKFAEFDEKELSKLALRSGDLLLIRSNGSLDLVGKLAVVSEIEESCVFAGYLIRLRLDLETVDARFVAYCLRSPKLRQVVENKARSTSGVNNINSKELASLEVPLPSLAEQKEVVRRVDQLFAFSDQIEQQVKNAQARVNKLTQSILARAFRGELTAEWRAENPELISGENSARALLGRIKAEKETLAPAKKRRGGRTAMAAT